MFVFSRDTRSALHRVYLLWGLSLTVWNVGTCFMFRVQNPADALFWAKFLQAGVIFLPVSLLHLSLLTARVPRPKWLPYLYGLHGLLAAADLAGGFVRSVHWTGYAYYSQGAPLFWLFTDCRCGRNHRLDGHAPRTPRVPLAAEPRARQVADLGAGHPDFFGNNDLLPILGIYRYPFTDWRIYPLGSLAAIFYGFIVAYSALLHQLLDIQFALGRAAGRICGCRC